MDGEIPSRLSQSDPSLSLFHLLEPEILADPYPLYRRLRTEDPVYWDPFLHVWVVTRYQDVVRVLRDFSAHRTPTPEQLSKMDLSALSPVARVMVKQMLFMDAPAHTRLRGLASQAFAPQRVEILRSHIQELTDKLIDAVIFAGRMDVIADLAEPLPCIVTAEMLGVPVEDRHQLKAWSADFAEMLGNFQHNPDRAPRIVRSVEDMTAYFRAAMHEQEKHPREGLVHSLMVAEVGGDRLTEEEVIANCIVTMVGGQETTTNLIGSGTLALLRNPEQLERLKADPALISSAVEELLRYESPSQHTARIAPEDVEMGGRLIRKGQAVIAVMGAANRDPERFPDPDRLDITRRDNRHVAFGWAAHFCFGAPLARIEGQIAFATMLARLPNLVLEPGPLTWRDNLGLRGLKALSVKFGNLPSSRSTLAESPCPDRRRFRAEHGRHMIPGTGQITDAKRELLEKLLRDDAIALGDADAFPRRVPGEPVPLSFGQEQLWLHSQLAAGSPLYNEPVTVRKIGSLDAAVLERSLNEIIRRHEAWRTTFTTVDGQPIQVVHSALHIPLPVADLTHLPEDAREQEAARLATEDARRPFDLAQGPLLRARLVKLAENEHRLFLSLHHMTFDGVSIYRIFLSELIELYNDFSKGRPSPLEDLPIQYGDYVAWERKVISEEAESEHLDYWRHQLRGVLPELRLPTDRPRPNAQTFRGSMLPFALSKSLTESLRALSKRECTTLYTTMLTAFIALLYRYSGQEDILVGTVTSTRRRPELESLIGFFVNTLVLRSDVSGQPTFRELLGRGREVVVGALSHEVPYQHLLNKLYQQRRASRNPMFQVLFSLVPSLPTTDPAWKVTHMDVENGGAKFDLSLELDERSDAIIGRFVYNTDLFSHATMERIAGHWRTLLEGIVADPGRPIAELPLLTEPERHQLLVECNDTAAGYPRNLCVHELFEAQAARAPDNVAVVFEDQRLSYRELNRLANRVAHRLCELGVGPDVRVGICVERSLEMIVGLLAILKAGGAYLPLDPEYPKQRLAFMLEDARMPVLLTQRRWLERLPDCGVQIVELDGYIDPMAGEDSENLRAGTTAGNLAYVLYTSGSTGSPKGVEIPHRGIARLLFGTDYAKLDEHEVLLQISPLSFDASTFEIWGALLRGGCCVLFPGRVPSARALGDVLAEHRVSTLWLTTSLFNAVIDEAPEVLSNVGQLLVGGEALSVPHVRRALELLPNVHLINGYGPTESTTFACCYAIPKHVDPAARSIPIGSPIANTRVYVLDQRMELVPAGVPGELHIGGDGLARGYLSRPELTAERFVPDPFSSERGSRLYKTGDLARYLPDGNIEFLGRMDDQVKIRGFRVEPGEVEVALAAHPGVKATAVECQEWTGEKCLVAYWVAKEVPRPSINDLRRFLQEKLPQHMVPAAFVRLDAIPLTPSGKVDRPGLPAITNLRFPHDEIPEAPQDRSEIELAQIWEGVLGTRPIGVNDNFFDLGGDSLAAARVLARVEKAFGKELSMAALFQAATIRQLAALLRAQGCSSDGPSVGTIKPGGSRPPFFCVLAGAIFRALTQRLEADLPVLSLNLDPSEIKQLSFPYRLEEIAECLVKTIRRQQPAGPYYLGGFCINGVVAYEVAQQLMAQGQRVALLALFDSANPIYAKTVATGVRYWAQRVRFHVASLSQNGFKDMHGFIMERLKGMLDNARRDWWSVTSRLRLQPANGLRDLDQIVYLAARAYQPQPYAGRVVLFRPADRILDLRYGWGDLVAGGIDVKENPGDHLSILQAPNHEILASSLTACLREASEHEEQVSAPIK